MNADNLTEQIEEPNLNQSLEEAFEDPSLYFNRELSWLDFNYRVIEEALDPENPILEQLNF